jgi:hypothetical protein
MNKLIISLKTVQLKEIYDPDEVHGTWTEGLLRLP